MMKINMKTLKLLLIISAFSVSSNTLAADTTANATATIVAALTLSLGADVSFTQAAQNTGAATKTLTVTMSGTSGESAQFNYDTSITMTHTSWVTQDSTKEIVITVVDTGFAGGASGNTVTLTGGATGGDLRLSREAIAVNDTAGDYSTALNATITYNSL